MESTLLATILNPANLTRTGTTTTVVFQTADILAYVTQLTAQENTNVTNDASIKSQLLASATSEDTATTASNAKLTTYASLTTLLS